MNFDLKVADKALVVTLEGEFDLHTSPPFKELVAEALEKNPTIHHLIIVIDKVSFIDSSGLGVILGRYRSISQKGGRLFFVNSSPQIKRILELSGFQKIASFVETTREALDRI